MLESSAKAVRGWRGRLPCVPLLTHSRLPPLGTPTDTELWNQLHRQGREKLRNKREGLRPRTSPEGAGILQQRTGRW